MTGLPSEPFLLGVIDTTQRPGRFVGTAQDTAPRAIVQRPLTTLPLSVAAIAYRVPAAALNVAATVCPAADGLQTTARSRSTRVTVIDLETSVPATDSLDGVITATHTPAVTPTLQRTADPDRVHVPVRTSAPRVARIAYAVPAVPRNAATIARSRTDHATPVGGGAPVVEVGDRTNTASTCRAALATTEHVAEVPEHAPPHRLSTHPAAGDAVRVTTVPGAMAAVHADGQSSAPMSDVTVPVPSAGGAIDRRCALMTPAEGSEALELPAAFLATTAQV